MNASQHTTATIPIKRALLSVSDKGGIVDFARALEKRGVEILSTGGTASLLRDSGIKVTDVSAFTGFPEIMDGRVKTLHPKIHGGILARRDEESHRRAMKENGIGEIDLVAVSLYPFAQTVRAGKDDRACVENIDIGGPAMIRAAAKNHDFVAILTDPRDYADVLSEMDTHGGGVTFALRKRLAAQAYGLTAWYDSQVAQWMHDGAAPRRHITISGTLKQTLRYGENPHQSAALYAMEGEALPGAAYATQIQGKELSFNNINDTNAAFELVAEFDSPAVAIIKHANPCGVAASGNLLDAYENALRCDPVSAFGGIIALNRPLDKATAAKIMELFVEVIIAPSVEQDALAVLGAKPNIRLLTTGALPDPARSRMDFRPVAGGILLQSGDTKSLTAQDLKIVTKRAPTDSEMTDLLFAMRVAKHVKSNAIVYARGGATVGIGAGQMSRVDSARIAAWKMGEAGLADDAGHPVVASDAFFPFADGLISAAEAGVTAVIQPGGSIRDAEVIAAADERGLAMVFTGIRHFRH